MVLRSLSLIIQPLISSNSMLTTTEAATELGIKPDSVKHLCQRKVLRGERHGRDWLISREELDRYKTDRKTRGRPKHAADAAGE